MIFAGLQSRLTHVILPASFLMPPESLQKGAVKSELPLLLRVLAVEALLCRRSGACTASVGHRLFPVRFLSFCLFRLLLCPRLVMFSRLPLLLHVVSLFSECACRFAFVLLCALRKLRGYACD